MLYIIPDLRYAEILLLSVYLISTISRIDIMRIWQILLGLGWQWRTDYRVAPKIHWISIAKWASYPKISIERELWDGALWESTQWQASTNPALPWPEKRWESVFLHTPKIFHETFSLSFFSRAVLPAKSRDRGQKVFPRRLVLHWQHLRKDLFRQALL